MTIKVAMLGEPTSRGEIGEKRTRDAERGAVPNAMSSSLHSAVHCLWAGLSTGHLFPAAGVRARQVGAATLA
jgi:hypothetical protein